MQAVTDATFDEATAGYRAELLAHCYRMLGSVHEAEDLVQETYLRAWRSFDAFRGDSSIRTYLYRIATNVCLTALRQRSRRMMPASRSVDEADPHWLQPIPDTLLSGDGADPETRAGIRLAFIVALQHLPPMRRAALILRDVLSFSAAETAAILGTTAASVNSALLRAREQMARVAPVVDTVREPRTPDRRALVDRYVAAFESADIPALARLMRTDIALEMPPLPAWYQGRDAVTGFLATRVLDRPERFRLSVSSANGQPAVVARVRSSGHPHAVHVLTWWGAELTHIAVFLDPRAYEPFLG